MHCLDNFSEMTVDGQALAVCDYMHGSGITINRGGTMRFSSFHDFDIDYKEIETLLDYMIEKDMLIVARRAPGNIINKKEIIREELFTYNNYSGIIPSKLFESGNSIIKFYKSSPQERVLDVQKAIHQYNNPLEKLKMVGQAVYGSIIAHEVDGESLIFDKIKHCTGEQLDNFLKLDPNGLATSFYDGKPNNYSGIADYFAMELLKSL